MSDLHLLLDDLERVDCRYSRLKFWKDFVVGNAVIVPSVLCVVGYQLWSNGHGSLWAFRSAGVVFLIFLALSPIVAVYEWFAKRKRARRAEALADLEPEVVGIDDGGRIGSCVVRIDEDDVVARRDGARLLRMKRVLRVVMLFVCALGSAWLGVHFLIQGNVLLASHLFIGFAVYSAFVVIAFRDWNVLRWRFHPRTRVLEVWRLRAFVGVRSERIDLGTLVDYGISPRGVFSKHRMLGMLSDGTEFEFPVPPIGEYSIDGPVSVESFIGGLRMYRVCDILGVREQIGAHAAGARGSDDAAPVTRG